MRAALVVNPVTPDLDANLAAVLRLTHAAADAGADIVVFPEAALTGLANSADGWRVSHDRNVRCRWGAAMADRAPHFAECDFHTHTELSGEAQSEGFSLPALFRAADEMGLRYVGYSEHWHLGTPVDLFRRIRDEVDRLQGRFRVKVYVSAEIDVLNSRGDLSCDLDAAVSALDYVSVAISHYGAPGVEQLLSDRVDDTVRMIEAVCAIPAVTMLMHPQIVYGRSLEHIARAVPPGVYDHVMGLVAAGGKVVDYPSVRMNADWLGTLYGADKLAIERESFREFTRAVVARGVRLAPGSDAHNAWWHGSAIRWLGNNADSLALLETNGYRDAQLWYGPPGGGGCL